MNLCRSCNEDFASLTAFDEHRTGVHDYTLSEGLKQEPPVEDGRRCFAAQELEQFGWTKDERGRWQYPEDWEHQAWTWDAAVLRSRTFVVSPGTVAPVEAGGADVRDLSTAALTERESLLPGVGLAPLLPGPAGPAPKRVGEFSGKGHGRSRSVSAVASPPADTQPPSVAALSPWEQARQAWLRFESRVPVQLELV